MTDSLPTPDDERRWRNCLHESGHAWGMHALLGAALGVVSVRRGVGRYAHGGVTIGDPEHPLTGPRIDGTALDGLDPFERQLGDRLLVMLLLGDEAEEALELWTPTGGFGSPVNDDAVPETLTPAVTALLAEAEAEVVTEVGQYDPKTDPSPSDTRQAFDLATALVGPDTSGHYVRWAMAEARQAARTSAAVPIHALASALWTESVIDGRRVADIFDNAHERSTNA